MENQEHLKKLKEGAKVWNQWRDEHKDMQPNLRGVYLRGANLNNADFRDADLRDADLKNSDLNNADFRDADLKGADLTDADLRDADLTDADLNNVDLRSANLNGANLNNVDLRSAVLWDTHVSNVDLRTTKGLLEIQHGGPSRIELHSVQLPQDGSASAFLRGAGVPDEWISFYQATMQQPIQYYSLFISYSSKDEAFAKRLYADLQSHNVRCWFAPEDLKWGEKIRTGIDEAIRLHDKLLLILSKSSVASGWVEHEVKAALLKERKEKRTTLFPVRVDKAVLDSPLSWATEIRHERNIGDFTRWKTHDEYQKAFARLLRDLKQTEVKGE